MKFSYEFHAKEMKGTEVLTLSAHNVEKLIG